MNNKKIETKNKRYTLATRDIDLEGLLVTGVLLVLLIVCACLVEDQRFIFVPLLFLLVSTVAFISLLFRYFTEPKNAIQADCNGIYICYRNNKEVFVNYSDIVEVSFLGIRNKYGRLQITTKENQYKSIKQMNVKTSCQVVLISF